MRFIDRVEAPQWSSDKFPKAAGSSSSGPIAIFWGKPMPGTANGRGLGKWGCIMISLCLALARREDRRLTKLSVPAKGPDVLGIDLNCSESRSGAGFIGLSVAPKAC